MNGFVSNKPGETITDKLGLGSEVRELKFGAGFSGNRARGGPARNDSFHTIRYDFKPASVDTTQQATVEVGSNNQVTISIPHSDGTGANVFKGPRKPYAKECVLIIDHITGEVTLEKLGDNITVKKTRPERPEGSSRPNSNSSKPPAPAPPPPPTQEKKNYPPPPPPASSVERHVAPPPVPTQPERKSKQHPSAAPPPPVPSEKKKPNPPPLPPLPSLSPIEEMELPKTDFLPSPPQTKPPKPVPKPTSQTKEELLSEMSSSDDDSSSGSSSSSESESSDDDMMDVEDVPVPSVPIMPMVKHLPKLPTLPSHKVAAPSMPLFDSPDPFGSSSASAPPPKGLLSTLVNEDLQLSEESDSDSD